MKSSNLITAIIAALLLALAACGGGGSDTADAKNSNSSEAEKSTQTEYDGKGIGPVKNVELGSEINEQMVARGKEVFEAKCTACHEFEEKYVGPKIAGVTDNRKPEWIMNMILNPEEMTKEDPIAKKLFEEHLTQMTFQDVSREDARAMLEYFRKYDKEN